MKLPKHKYLLTYRYAEIIHDLTAIFVKKYIDYKSRTRDQMEQAGRSAKQNIVEGVSEGQTSKKGEIKFLGFAKSSTDELLTDYEDFLRQKGLKIYPKNHPKITSFRQTAYRLSNLKNLSNLGHLIEKPKLPGNSTDDANLLLTLCHQLSYLLDRQIKSEEFRFINEGGYSENLFLKRLKKLKLLKSPKVLNSFTLIELLIVIALIALLGVAALVLINPKKQLEKAWDTQRKYQLAKLQKVFEDYYNDNSAYPKDENVCYDQVNQVEDSCFCHICGLSAENNFSPYLPRLFCDPQHPKKSYFYQYDCATQSPAWYRICASLSDESNYSVASPNLSPGKCVVGCPADPQNKYCWKTSEKKIICNNCGKFSNCTNPYACNQPPQLYRDFNCQTPCD